MPHTHPVSGMVDCRPRGFLSGRRVSCVFYDIQLLPSISKGGLVHLFPLKISEVTLQSVSLTFFHNVSSENLVLCETFSLGRHFNNNFYSHHLSVK